MKLSEIHIRDPFIVPFDGKYYLFGSNGRYAFSGQDGFFCHISEDLEEWSDAIRCFEKPDDFWSDHQYWAPEVHGYNGKFYLFATFHTADGSRKRTCQILAADKPEGPYCVWSEPITPPEWMSLDGTLYVENGIPYMVFCHEWVQTGDGEMCAVQLSADLKRAVSEPVTLFKASEPAWASDHMGGFVTDGPFLRRNADGKLLMIWSSFDQNGYVEAVAVSESGTINGPWQHCQNVLVDTNGGHGMLFTDFGGQTYFVMHRPNDPYGAERAHLFPIKEINTDPYLQLVECEEC